MFEITKETLRWSYEKLKNYIFFYNSSHYLKDKIIQFESNYNEHSFELMADELNAISSINRGLLSNRGVEFCIYPKKDGVAFNNGNIKIEKYNFFIDMPLKFYLVDILFTLDLFEVVDRDDFRFSFGNSFDDRLYDILSGEFQDENILSNKLLFANHTIKYKEWKNSICKALTDNDDVDKVVFKLDLQRCFYNIFFNIKEFIRNKLGVDPYDDPVTKIVCNLYSYYSKIIDDELNSDFFPKTNYVHLPIGLFSSYVVLNCLLNPLDEQLSTDSLCYARYVDDILIIKEKNESIHSKGLDKLKDYFPNILKEAEDLLTFNSDTVGCKLLIINKDKVKICEYKKGISNKKIKKKSKNFSNHHFLIRMKLMMRTMI